MKPEASRLYSQAVGAFQAGAPGEALALARRALRLAPREARLLSLLGVLCAEAGEMADSLDYLSKAVALAPNEPGGHVNLGRVLLAQGEPAKAAACLKRATQLVPEAAPVLLMLANAQLAAGDLQAAADNYQGVLSRQPDATDAWLGWVDALVAMGRVGEALAAVDNARRTLPADPRLAIAAGRLLLRVQRAGEATAAYRHARALGAGDPRIALEFAVACLRSGSYDEALPLLEDLWRLNPDDVDVRIQLAWVLPAMGRDREALDHLRKAIELAPGNRLVYSALLVQLNYFDQLDAGEIFAHHQAYGVRFRESPVRVRERAPDRQRLRVAYLSNGFGRNALASFIEGVLSGHRRQQVEVFCYRTGGPDDEVTARQRALADAWVDCHDLGDLEIAERIAADGVDILVDLMGHTAGNRLGVLARRPAPLQVTWVGYLNTTGMTEVDYRLTDRIADPEAVAAPLHCEKLAYLPDTQWCFRPPVATPEVSELPALANAFVTFASFNAFHKLSPTTLQLFAEVLAAVPAARLVMFDVAPGRQSEYVAAVFAARGIERERLRLLPRSSIEVFYQTRCEVDIALDSFPYSGGTTTCESLWMGVPVVTMRGQTSPSRSSASLLTACALEHLIASEQGEYVRIARDLAADRAGLSRLRQELRQRMQASPIMDIGRFVAGLEGVYQSLWAGRAGC